MSEHASPSDLEGQKTVSLSFCPTPCMSPEPLTRKNSSLSHARLKNAKLLAENAVKVGQFGFFLTNFCIPDIVFLYLVWSGTYIVTKLSTTRAINAVGAFL